MKLIEKADAINRILHANRQQILSVLSKIETKITAEDEWERATECFKSLDSQVCYLSAGEVHSIASFLPLNQPLYSFILFVVVPSFTSQIVIFRPPMLLWGIFTELMRIFSDATAESITMCQITRRDFLEKYVRFADVVVFTGEYDNAMDVMHCLKDGALFLFNGGALNPMIITATADIAIAVRDVIRERLFNSGQDCMAPCAILLSREIAPLFIQTLMNDLKHEIVGPNAAINTTVGQMIDFESIETTRRIVEVYRANLVFGGEFDEESRIVYPSVFLFDKISLLPQQLVFAPLFFVGIYDSFSDIKDYLSTDMAQDLSGYISVYTNSPFSKDELGYCEDQVLVNESLFVFESANKEFGGYGKRCSFSYKNGEMQIHPLLISREIANNFYFM